MDKHLHEYYSSLDDDKLKNVLRNFKDYEDEALKSVISVLQERGIYDKTLSSLRKEIKDKKKEIEIIRFSDNLNPWKRLEFPSGSITQVNFEKEILLNGLNFYKEDTNDYGMPIIRYYFSDEEFSVANSIGDKIKMQPPNKPKKSLSTIYSTLRSWIGIIFIAVVIILIIKLILDVLSDK